jgi:hypothetical protein
MPVILVFWEAEIQRILILAHLTHQPIRQEGKTPFKFETLQKLLSSALAANSELPLPLSDPGLSCSLGGRTFTGPRCTGPGVVGIGPYAVPLGH